MINLLGTLGTLFDIDLDPSGKGLEYLGGMEQTAATASSLGPVYFDSLPFIVITGRIVWTGATADVFQMRFNNDAGNNYWWRTWHATGTTAVFTNTNGPTTNNIRMGNFTSIQPRTFLAACLNLEGLNSPVMNQVSVGTGSASTIGALQFGCGEYVSTSLINSVSFLTLGGTASFGPDTGFAVFGAAI